jgi:hypothetical protein
LLDAQKDEESQHQLPHFQHFEPRQNPKVFSIVQPGFDDLLFCFFSNTLLRGVGSPTVGAAAKYAFIF